ncbi:MAG: methyltransferase domain-containing protein [Candidatus Riflebacteria bacterium]|nr:methyltransferase domain-containing protein [Candidatus Riflebacteria bacterium]
MEQRIQSQFTLRAPTFERSASWIADPGLLQTYVDSCQMPPDSVLLDVCCGTGIVGGAFRDRVRMLVGLDLTEAMLEQAVQKLDRCYQGSVYEMPFPDDTFDVVISREAWHLLEHPGQAVQEMFRVARPGAQILYGHIVPYGPVDKPWMEQIFRAKQPLATRFYTEEDLRDMMEAAGFRNLTARDYPLWELIDLWIDTHETPPVARHTIRNLYSTVAPEVTAVHPAEVRENGEIWDCWRWVVLSGFKPAWQEIQVHEL